MNFLKNILVGVLDILLPAFCVNCNAPLEKRKIICEACYNSMNKIDTNLIHTFIDRIQKQHFDNIFIIFEFSPLFQQLMHLFKYEGYVEIASYFADSIAEVLLQDYDIVTCVPLNDIKKRERGFNQSEVIAKIIAKKKQYIFKEDLLIRNRYTISQTKLNREDRMANVSNAFFVNSKVTDKTILIIDDVTTTGSTLNECANELKESGCKSVDILALATPTNILQEKLETEGFRS